MDVRLGDFELYLLVASRMKFDGGLAFGVVPKLLWEKEKPADERNLVDAACVAAVVRHRGKVIVCETGIGAKLSEKRAQQVVLREPEGLLAGLKRIGVRPEEVDVVLSTHLHWDHAGGMTRRGPQGSLALTFPRAKHFVQRSEWDFALEPDVRSRSGYLRDDFLPVEEAGLIEFVEGDAEILPGVELRQTGGHTPGHQVLVFRAGSDLACAFTGDIVAMRPHLRTAWNLGADLDVVRALEAKARLLDEASRHRWLLVLSHETENPAGYLDPDGRWTPEPKLELEPAGP
jgi:glyoxylase-like metal-dependent hydrolase (beta-lactamase superfamily II)